MTGAGRVGVAVVGAGVISRQYLATMTALPDLDVRSVADLDVARAVERAAEFGVPGGTDLAGVLADSSIEIVVNLTVPAAHVEVGIAALEAGKHVWSEKPLAPDADGARLLLHTARRLGLRVACAPDTLLGPAAQTLRAAIARGDIGTPVVATAAFEGGGPESWHPAPEFFYAAGGGPLFDMGPYYVAGLVHVLGSVTGVSALSARPVARRIVGSGPRAGERFPVEVPTTVAALLAFRSGAIAHATFSFDAVRPRVGVLEIAGTAGHLVAADPNMFDGDVTLVRDGAPVLLPGAASVFRRGLGVLDLARAIRADRPERLSGELGAHVLDILLAIDLAGREHRTVEVVSTAPEVPALESDWDPAAATLGSA